MEGLLKSLLQIVTAPKGMAELLLPGTDLSAVPEAGTIADRWYLERLLRQTRHSLNASQAEAVLQSASQGLTLVQGPPGTGKTTVAAELCRLMVMQRKKVLVCAVKNVALDNILMQVLDCFALRPTGLFSPCHF